MSEVKVNYGDNVAGVASQLLAAARSLELSTSVVRTTSDNHFLVPEEVADEAGLSFDAQGDDESASQVSSGAGGQAGFDNDLSVPEGTVGEQLAWVLDGEDESERTKRANAVHSASDLEGEELENLNADLTVAVHGVEKTEQPKAPAKKVAAKKTTTKTAAKKTAAKKTAAKKAAASPSKE